MIKTIFICGACLVTVVYSRELYRVKKGDTLSEILDRRFPHARLYGKEGKIKKILKLNPEMGDPDLIFPGQSIKLRPAVDQEVNKIFPEQSVQVMGPNTYDWDISPLYGFNYTNISQSGDFVKAKLGVFLLHTLDVKSRLFLENNSSLELNLSSHRFLYNSSAWEDSVQLHAARFELSYDWMIGGIGVKQLPIFRNVSDKVEISKQSLVYGSFGAEKDFSVFGGKSTQLNAKFLFLYPFSSTATNTNVELSSMSGWGCYGEAEFKKLFYAKDNYDLFISWVNRLKYVTLTQSAVWGDSSGRVGLEVIEATSSFGATLSF